MSEAQSLAVIIEQLLHIRGLLERIVEQGEARAQEVPRRAGIIATLASHFTADELDEGVDFEASEAWGWAQSEHALLVALKRDGATSSMSLGARLSTAKGATVNGVRLVRHGRAWRLQRTSCT